MSEQTPQALFEQLRAKAVRTERDVFKRRFGGWYLICKPPSTSGPQGRMAFRTESYGLLEVGDLLRNVPQGQKPSEGEASEMTETKPAGSDLDLYRIEKSDPGSWPRRISVGRAPNNDVVLRYKTVSKLHAHIHFDPDLPASERKLALEDVGSHNGTRLNGRFMKPDQPAELDAGDIIAFGSLKSELLDAGGLFDMLKQLDLLTARR